MSDLEEHFDRLKWVSGEIDRLDEQLSAYAASKPLEVYWHLDFHPTNPTRLYKLRSIINEMRAILDALACTLAMRNGAEDLSATAFPTGKGKATFESRDVQRRIRLLSDSDKALITNLEPYRGGNEMLYALHSTDIIRKHRRLLIVGAEIESSKLGSDKGWVLDGSKLYHLHAGPAPLDGEPIARLAHDYHIDIEVDALVSFSEPDEIKGKPVIQTLAEFSALVGSILEIFDRNPSAEAQVAEEGVAGAERN